MTSQEKLKQIVEAALLAAGRPLNMDQLLSLFDEQEQPEKQAVREALQSLMQDYQGRGIEVVEVGSGYRIQVSAGLSPWVSRLWAERPPKYSRALLETLALIAYRQPITRGEIEDIRGVSVSSNIIKTLTEREWVRVVGHRDVPGKPSLYATTKEFLDYFNLSSLNELPTLAEIRDFDSINRELELNDPDKHEEPQAKNGGNAETDDEVTSSSAELIVEEIEEITEPEGSVDSSSALPLEEASDEATLDESLSNEDEDETITGHDTETEIDSEMKKDPHEAS